MKILMLTPYVTLNGHPEFMRNQTGFGHMVYDIARAVAETEQVEVLAWDSRGEAFAEENVQFLGRSWVLSLKHIWKGLPISILLNLCRKYRMSKGSKVRLCYYWLFSGYFRYVILKGKYDVVHIHGCSFSTELWIALCKWCGQKFLVTLHGLNSFSGTVRLETAGKQYERDFLKRVVGWEFPITVISTGMRRMIENTYGVVDCPSITVICNSFVFPGSVNAINVREKYIIPAAAKVILYVGNISHNKNQVQIARAFALLPKTLREQTYVLFCGGGEDEGLNEAISNCAEKEHLVLCGVVDKDSMSNYYKTANGVALLSYSEGFGLSLIEGMHFGVPCLMFSDMDAFEDIYDENAVVEVKDRTDKAVVEGLVQLLTRSWDHDTIKANSRKFENKSMAEKYLNVYEKVCNDHYRGI